MVIKHVYDIGDFPLSFDSSMSDFLRLAKIPAIAHCSIYPSDEYYNLEKVADRSYRVHSRIALDALRKLFGLIAHVESDATLLHAGLTVRDGKNIVVSGSSGAGKTTLCTALGNVVEDDTLLYNNGYLHTLTTHGFMAFGQNGDKVLDVAKLNAAPKKPDLFLLLNKNMVGGYCVEVFGVVERYYLPNMFSSSNEKLYKNTNTFVKPDVPAFVLGTNGNLEKTVATAKELVRSLS